MKFKPLAAMAATAAGALFLAGCSTVSADGDDGDNGNGSDDSPFTIGVSNAFVGSEYRTQMIDDIKDTFEEYEDEGLVDELVLENADTDVSGQIQQVRNLINKGVDAIIIDPESATALDAVFTEATDQGIDVYAIDQAVESENVTNVGIDQGEWAGESAEWLAGELDEGDDIVVVNGTSGNPANEARWGVAQEVFDDAGINVLTEADGGWDQAKGQQTMSNLLATYSDIDGVWTQDGMAQGVLKAVKAADKLDDIVVTGEARVGYMRMWSELIDDDFSSVGVVNPPGTGATALHLAIGELQGKTIDPDQLEDGHSVVLDLEPAITNDNFEDEWDKVSDEDDSFVMDSVLTKDEAAQYFE